MEENKQIDLGTFALYDSKPFQLADQDQIENILTQRMVQNIYFSFESAVNAKKLQLTAIQSLPQQQQIHDFQASKLQLKLPQSSILLPRSQRVPDKKVLTKWQKFAKQKGIKKRKRFAKKYDSTINQDAARWGGKSKKNAFQPAIMEEKQAGRNPFQDQKNKRKLVQQSQKLRQLKNKQFRQTQSSR